MTDAMTFLQTVSGFTASEGSGGSADRPIKLAVIDPAFDPAQFPAVLPKVKFEGESTVSGKFYAVASPYWPQPSDKVWMVPIGSTYLIVGSREAGLGGVYIGGDIHIPGVRKRVNTSRLTTNSGDIDNTETVIQTVQAQLLANKWYEVGIKSQIGTRASSVPYFVVSLKENNLSGNWIRRKREVTAITSSIYEVEISQEYLSPTDQLKTFVATLSTTSGEAVYRRAADYPAIMYVDYVREG